MAGDQVLEPGERLKRERALYRRLVDIGRSEDVAMLLSELLAEAVRITGAEVGYIELTEPGREGGPQWWTARGANGETVETMRRRVSSGIIRAARASGRVFVTDSAILDTSLRRTDSLIRNRIEAVLTCPVGDAGSQGLLYLQRATGAGTFDESAQALLEIMASAVRPIVGRVLAELGTNATSDRDDPTARFRRHLCVDELVGHSEALAAVFEQIEVVANYAAPVLLLGPSGVGKTAIARAIHASSERCDLPFEKLGCGGSTSESFRSQAFGVNAGRFTGVQAGQGIVERAGAGTLFFDDIDALDLDSQKALLDLVDEGVYERYGDTTKRHSPARVIAASNADLEAMCARGAFRRDLLFRLDVLTIDIPPLAQRSQDIPALAHRFCAEICRSEGISALSLSEDAVRTLESREWPGNVRELRSAVRRGVYRANAQGATLVRPSHLLTGRRDSDATTPVPTTWDLEASVREHRRALIERALDAEQGNVSAAAKRLSVSRSTLYKYMKELGVRAKR